ncbi:flagellin lysine-N-methylase [Clostridium chrysemydis]|uniref:flagellin lysine-N-methylase n=1 Tax=Clostridium chrysemydis TaxID=2665504 RepID=UPI0018837D2D|nr:flagellin lysine-N-methylase [Clostridium chrysemydis]
MKFKVPDYFNEFSCIGGACEDTCCAGWEIVIDDKTFNKYKNVKGDFKKILDENIIKSDEDNVFRLKEENCFFLNNEKMCEIYKNLGEEYLCHTCKEFPRVTEEFLDVRESLLSLSCPEASRIILSEPREIKFKIKDIDEEIIEDSNIERGVLDDFLNCREVIFKLLERKDISFNKRLVLILNFSNEIQNKIDLGDMDEIKDVIRDYLDNEVIVEILKETDRENFKKESNTLKSILNTYIDLNHINSNDILKLNSASNYLKENEKNYLNNYKKFDEAFKENLFIFESLINYFVFRYFMKCIFDYDMSSKVKFAIISTTLIKELSIIEYLKRGNLNKEDVITIARNYSKDIEHSDENVESLFESFETKDLFNIENLTNIIMKLF